MQCKKKWLFWILILLGVTLLLRISREIPVIKEADAQSVILHDPISGYLEKLASCESDNNPAALNPKDGGSPSFGYLQFKIGTFTAYARKYGLFSHVEDAEMANIIMDKDAQLAVAGAMLRDSMANSRHWRNCWRITRLPNK